ncbi:MAG: hypothetical protein KDA95_11230 [Acidimicrobiales bacterium]|nr:hypothetical protein [Acidimicrobiales bacterium]
MTESWVASTLHMGVVLVSVLAVGIFARGPAAIVTVTAYAGVSDVLWRATNAKGPYEASKYAVIVGAIFLAVRFAKESRYRTLGLVLAALLAPGAAITIMRMGAAGREHAAANLAGLLALAAIVAAWGSLRLTLAEVRGLYLVVLGPIVALTASATLGTLRASDLEWTNEGNLDASAGFGPNQVSSLMALGALLSVLVAFQRGVSWRLRVIAITAAVWLVSQMVLTFSRGGVFGLVLALAAAGLVALLTSGQRLRTVVAAGVLLAIGIQIMSWAGAFTDGASDQRFTSTDTTNRWDIAVADVELFFAKPIFGSGAGMATFDRGSQQVAAHTEYTRLLAEHGLFGIGVLAVLAAICVRIVRSGKGWYRMASVGLLVLALGQMTHSATRIGSIAIAFGLAALREEQS